MRWSVHRDLVTVNRQCAVGVTVTDVVTVVDLGVGGAVEGDPGVGAQFVAGDLGVHDGDEIEQCVAGVGEQPGDLDDGTVVTQLGLVCLWLGVKPSSYPEKHRSG